MERVLISWENWFEATGEDSASLCVEVRSQPCNVGTTALDEGLQYANADPLGDLIAEEADDAAFR